MRKTLALSLGVYLLVAAMVSFGARYADAQEQTAKPKAATGHVLLASDVACTVKLDGDVLASLDGSGPKKVQVPFGEHLLDAVTPDGQKWSKVIKVTSAEQMVVKVEFGAAAGGAAGATASALLFISDAPALLEIDGQKAAELPGGTAEAPAYQKLAVAPGRHVVRVVAKDDARVAAGFDVKVGEGAQEVVRLSLAARVKGLKGADTLGLRWNSIPAGEFQMGCSPSDRCSDDEMPAHLVKITRPFEMNPTEVTVAQFEKYAAASGTPLRTQQSWGGPAAPVVNVTWDQAVVFCTWVGGRLPTEAEYEYAARAGSTAFRYGDLDEIAWYADDAGNAKIDATDLFYIKAKKDWKAYLQLIEANGNHPHEVGTKAPNAFGLYDMLGNVWEWCSDWYSNIYYQAGFAVNPIGPPSGEKRVIRGGGFEQLSATIRVSQRGGDLPTTVDEEIGFRCVRDTAAAHATVSSLGSLGFPGPGTQGAELAADASLSTGGLVQIASGEGVSGIDADADTARAAQDQLAFEDFRKRKEAQDNAERQLAEARAAAERQRVEAQAAADREDDRAFRAEMMNQLGSAIGNLGQTIANGKQIRHGDTSSLGITPSVPGASGVGATGGICNPIPPDWSAIQTPQVRQMAQPSNIDGAIQRAGSVAAALQAARGWLVQAQSTLKDNEAQWAQICQQIGTGADACRVFYTPNATTMLDSSRNELLLARDQVAYISGVVSVLECRAR
ncbi:MAG: SUMF1/EgtB/PvdO family nonheme iron enzyme [Thermoanaerobaculaceae bacterium]|jgi:formylglycine-generating enzyme required for sulfatase activity